jgi:hypothetical protein
MAGSGWVTVEDYRYLYPSGLWLVYRHDSSVHNVQRVSSSLANSNVVQSRSQFSELLGAQLVDVHALSVSIVPGVRYFWKRRSYLYDIGFHYAQHILSLLSSLLIVVRLALSQFD